MTVTPTPTVLFRITLTRTITLHELLILLGSNHLQQIYCQPYFIKVVLGFKINLQKLKGASLLYLLVLLSWVVSTSFSLFLLSELFFLETVFAPIQKWIPDPKLWWIPDSRSRWIRIPVHRIPDSNIKNLLNSGFRILLHEAIHGIL